MSSEITSHGRRGSARDSAAAHRFRRGSRLHVVGPASDVRLTLQARRENIPVVRHVLGAYAEALHLAPEVIEDIRLAVTEACANVVRHAYAGEEPGPIDVVIRPVGDRLDVLVADRGHGMGVSADMKGPGLGLPLIAALADRVELESASRGSRIAMSFTCHPRLGAA